MFDIKEIFAMLVIGGFGLTFILAYIWDRLEQRWTRRNS